MNIFQVDFESISALVVKQAIDNPIITTSQIKGDLQDIQARCGSVSLVIVDYVQLIEPMRRERGENRV
ncbi:MAG: hypothetical protein V7K71_30285 [Nostoc sp.]|uniref:hypothetical protein n=1 Tax=Nostoc sp. TaxID=1180 RepID=UPI002FF99B00